MGLQALTEPAINEAVLRRALQSAGASSEAIYKMVARALAGHQHGGVLVDLGCGAGALWPYVADRFDEYVGVDAVRYAGFPEEAEFNLLDVDRGQAPLPDGCADVVVAVETIEHVENPRALVREMARLCKPGGTVVVTTPNQLSLLSKLTLLFNNHFNAFADSCYPAHITALLEIDLRRIARECGLREVKIVYTEQGRIPGTARHWPTVLSKVTPRLYSDNVLLMARTPNH